MIYDERVFLAERYDSLKKDHFLEMLSFLLIFTCIENNIHYFSCLYFVLKAYFATTHKAALEQAVILYKGYCFFLGFLFIYSKPYRLLN